MPIVITITPSSRGHADCISKRTTFAEGVDWNSTLPIY